MPPEAVEELGIALGHDNRRNMHEETEGDHIEGVEPDTKRCAYCSIEYRNRPWHSSHEDLFRQCPMKWYLISVHGLPHKAAAREAEEGEAEAARREGNGETKNDTQALSHEPSSFSEGKT